MEILITKDKYMKNYNKHISILLLCLSLASCGSDGSLDFSATESVLRIASVQTTEAATTRAATAITTTGAQIGVFRIAATGYSSGASSSYTYLSGTWVAASDIYLNGRSANVCAYYPYNGSNTDATQIALASARYHTDIPADVPKDISYAVNQSVDATSAPLNFTMVHAYAMLKLVIDKQAGYSRKLSLAKVTLTSITTTAKLNITNGTRSNAATGNYTYEPTATGGAIVAIPETPDESCTTSALLIPYTIGSSGLRVTVDIKEDGVTTAKSLSCDITDLKNTALQAGTRYTAKLTLTATGLQAGTLMVADWTDKATTGGNAEFM